MRKWGCSRSCSCAMLQTASTPALFPYTTLFRSSRASPSPGSGSMSSCCTSRANTGCGCGRRPCSIATTTSPAPCASPPMRQPCCATWRASAGTTGGGATPNVRRLVVNADDFGLSPGVNDGILEAHAAGVVSSVSVLVNAPGWEHAVAALRGTGSLGVGLHLNLTAGEPVSEGTALG